MVGPKSFSSCLHMFSMFFQFMRPRMNLDRSTAPSQIESFQFLLSGSVQISFHWWKPWTVGHAPTLEARGRLLSPALGRSWTINSHRLTASEALTRNFSSATCASESAEEASWRRPRTLWLEMVGDAKLLHRKPWKSLESEKTSRCCFCEL
jgi:hypothetical protein